MIHPDLGDRLIGGLIGVLVGDALGVPVEFTSRSELDRNPIRGMTGNGTWNQPPGTWSDDSSMTLVAAESLTAYGWDTQAMMDGFLAWLDEAYWTPHGDVFDIGLRTRTSLMLYRIDRDITTCGGAGENDNGNGSLMRCMPVSCWLWGKPTDDLIRRAGAASALTHAHPRSRLCCAWHALWCRSVLDGHDAKNAANLAGRELLRVVPSDEVPHLTRILHASVIDQPRRSMNSDGYVISTAEAALWSVATNRNFTDTVLAAVNLGDDADTTGAVAGGMAGLLYGIKAIPPEWISSLARHDQVIDLARRFATACMTAGFRNES